MASRSRISNQDCPCQTEVIGNLLMFYWPVNSAKVLDSEQ